MDKKQQDPAGPAAALVWKARPIFVSSTFRDMHAERDFLREHGFKDMAERLRERCHYLDTIDLRQGVETGGGSDEAAREMLVLKVCLDEIERSKPFLVALLGDRYGWVPPAARIEAAARDAGMPPSVDVAGKSVTELEILYGVLENREQRKRSWFYFRTLDRTGMPPEVAARFPMDTPDTDPASPAGRLQALKDRVKREMPGRWREYTLCWDVTKNALTGLEAFDAQVVRDLWGDLGTETAAYLRDAPKTWQDADARAVTDFVAERTRGYVERPAVTDTLLAHALSPATSGADWGVIVSGAPGSGKSSLFGRAYLDLADRAAKGELLLLSHAAGIFPLSGEVDRMLRRWVSELAVRLDVADPIEAAEAAAAEEGAPGERPGERPRVTSEDIEQAFAQLLVRAAAQFRVVALVDALNQFDPTIRARYLTWLPKAWPPNARFVGTTLPGDAGTALTDKPGCHELDMPPVSRDEARAIAERFYRERHHRAVNPRVLDALLDKAQPDGQPAHGNPLWLALALQEMNLLEADDFERADREFAHLSPAARMEALQLTEAQALPPDIPGVYGELLARAERHYGEARTRAFMGLITVSRTGWRESDLRELMPRVSGELWDELAFAGIRRALGAHVVQRGAYAQWDFFHVSLRETVLRRDLADEAGRKLLHGIIADHLDSLPQDDPLRISETMVHLMGLGDRGRAAAYLALQWETRYRAAAQSALAASVAALTQPIQSAGDDAERGRVTDWIATLMQCGGNDQSHGVAQVALFDLNDALSITGVAQTEAARKKLLEAARETLERLAASDPSNAGWQRDLSVSQEKIGDVLRAQGDLAGGLRAYRESLAVRERLAASDPSNAGWQRDLVVSYWKMADIGEQSGQGDAAAWWRKAYDTLASMKQRGIMLPTDAQYLETLREKAREDK